MQSWDTASKATELSDYSAGTTWGIKGPRFYLLGVVRKRLAYPDLKREVVRQKVHFDADLTLIEDKASGTALIQDLIAEGVGGIQRCDPEQKDKVMRMSTQTWAIENGLVYLPSKLPGSLNTCTSSPSSPTASTTTRSTPLRNFWNGRPG